MTAVNINMRMKSKSNRRTMASTIRLRRNSAIFRHSRKSTAGIDWRRRRGCVSRESASRKKKERGRKRKGKGSSNRPAKRKKNVIRGRACS